VNMITLARACTQHNTHTHTHTHTYTHTHTGPDMTCTDCSGIMVAWQNLYHTHTHTHYRINMNIYAQCVCVYVCVCVCECVCECVNTQTIKHMKRDEKGMQREVERG
jgi:hypothetical protein